MKAAKTRSPMADVTNNIKGFMRSTTAHGFNYIADGENHWISRLFWTVVVIFGFTMAALMITSSWEEFQTTPISTTINTISISGMPLPAITIDAGSELNPWGYVEKIFDQVQIERIDNEPQNFLQSALLRKTFGFLFKAIFEKTFQVTKEYLPKQQDYLNPSMRTRLFLSTNFPNFDNISSKLATLIEHNTTSANDAINQIHQKTLDLFAQFSTKTSILYNWQSTFSPIVEAAFNKENITSSPCRFDLLPSNFTDACRLATIVLLQSSILRDQSYRGLGMGHLMSFFTPRISGARRTSFLASTNPTSFEKLIEKELISITKRLLKLDELEMSAFEMVKYVSLSAEAEVMLPAPVVEARYKCYAEYVTAWQSYLTKMTNKEGQPSKEYMPCYGWNAIFQDKSSGCCNLTKQITGQYAAVLRMMKYAQQAPHFCQSRDEYETDFSDIDQLLVFPAQNVSSLNLKTFGPRIFMCQFNNIGMTPEECNLFRRFHTNAGIGYTFNNGQFWDAITYSESNSIFHNAMSGKNSSDLDSEDFHRFGNPGTSPFLTLVLQSFQSQDPKDSNQFLTYKKKELFKITMNDPLTPADLRKDTIDLEPGYKHTIYITASRTVTAKNMKMIDPNIRKCRFRDEKPTMMTLFKEYTQKGCQFECQLQKGLQYCNCIPWNYPQIMENSKICDYMGAYCFDTILSNASILLSCDCINNCDINMYTYSVSSIALDLNDLCQSDNPLSHYFSEIGYSMPYSGFMRNYQRYVEKKDINSTEICKEVMKGMVFVDFRLASQMVTQVSQNMRMTIGDYISNFGGTLGLFTGMSILSLFEFLFWSVKIVLGLNKMTIMKKTKEKRKIKK